MLGSTRSQQDACEIKLLRKLFNRQVELLSSEQKVPVNLDGGMLVLVQ